MKLQQQFEERARERGFSIRKLENGDYSYHPTQRLWGWYQAGATAAVEYADPNFDMVESKIDDASNRAYFFQAYEG